ILSSENGDYAANVETAGIGTRTFDLGGEPTGERDLVHTPELKTIEEVGKFLKVKAPNFLKTLVFQRQSGGWVIAVVRGDHDLNENKLKALAGQDITMEFDLAAAEAAGFAIGFVGPDAVVGKDNVTLYVDHDAAAAQFWASGANQVDHHAKHFNWQRDVVAPLGDDAEAKLIVADIRNAAAGDPAPKNDGQTLVETHGIEVGHIFKLGTKYSISLDATFLDEDGESHPCIMGCYGIGINRILAGAIEQLHDENGIVLPMAIAPFEVEIIPIGNDKPAIQEKAEQLYADLKAAGVDVLLDDRDARPGVKFKDSELIGIPMRIVIGERGLAEGKLEFKSRTGDGAEMIDAEGAAEVIAARVAALR
nr:proline--tRNA ligase [Phycisphaerales bacterium]